MSSSTWSWNSDDSQKRTVHPSNYQVERMKQFGDLAPCIARSVVNWNPNTYSYQHDNGSVTAATHTNVADLVASRSGEEHFVINLEKRPNNTIIEQVLIEESVHYKKAHIPVWFLDYDGYLLKVHALRDTGCFDGNWISEQVVEDLGLEDMVTRTIQAPPGKGLDGKLLPDMGSIAIDYITAPGNRLETMRWFVLSSKAEIDAVFGVDHLQQVGAWDPERARQALRNYGRTSKKAVPFAARITGSKQQSKAIKAQTRANQIEDIQFAARLAAERERYQILASGSTSAQASNGQQRDIQYTQQHNSNLVSGRRS